VKRLTLKLAKQFQRSDNRSQPWTARLPFTPPPTRVLLHPDLHQAKLDPPFLERMQTPTLNKLLVGRL